MTVSDDEIERLCKSMKETAMRNTWQDSEKSKIKDVTKNMDKYDFHIVGNTLYDFVWGDFCDKYIELSKFYNDNTTKSVLIRVLTY